MTNLQTICNWLWGIRMGLDEKSSIIPTSASLGQPYIIHPSIHPSKIWRGPIGQSYNFNPHVLLYFLNFFNSLFANLVSLSLSTFFRQVHLALSKFRCFKGPSKRLLGHKWIKGEMGKILNNQHYSCRHKFHRVYVKIK